LDKLLTISEVANILHVSKNSLRTWDKEGKLCSVKEEVPREGRKRKEMIENV
jgi:DNA-binding transcriptional MerR regulator